MLISIDDGKSENEIDLKLRKEGNIPDENKFVCLKASAYKFVA